MRGEVLHYDESQGIGFISGDDNNRYTFARSDLRHESRVTKGTRIDFRADGHNAREVLITDTRRASTPRVPTSAPLAGPQEFGRFAPSFQPELGLWGYFVRAVTSNYVNFRDRARRKEYWSFVLFFSVAMIAAGSIGLSIDASMNYYDNTGPIATGGLIGLTYLALLLPSISVTVRRLHDVGLSGWFALLFYVLALVYIGGIILFVIALMPSQKHDNKWGPIPAGVS